MAADRQDAAARPGGASLFGLTPVRRQRLYEVLAERIVDFVEAQGLGPGQRLPPERELSARLGVSRATLSQALVALEVRGVIDVRHGDGAVLRAEAGAGTSTGTGTGTGGGTGAGQGGRTGALGGTAEQLREAIAPVLAELAALAARRGGAATRPALEALRATARDGGPVTDAALVVALGAASASPVLAALAGQLVVEPRPLDAAAAASLLDAVLAPDATTAAPRARELVARPSREVGTDPGTTTG